MDHRHEVDSTAVEQAMGILVEDGIEGMSRALEILLNEAMKVERSAFLGAGAYERSDQRRGYANGTKPKTVETRIGRMNLAIPQVREVESDERFYPKSLERGLRSERALKLAVAEMYVKGVSTRKVVAITEKLCGLSLSSMQVSRASKLLDEELNAWRQRPIGEIPAVILDARYEKVRDKGKVTSSAVLLAIGVNREGKRSVLGVSVSRSEAEVHWRKFLASLKKRGMTGVQYITADQHAGLAAAREAELPGVPNQRCQFHLQQNAMHYVPTVRDRKAVAADIRSIFQSDTRAEANQRFERMLRDRSEKMPELMEWLEEALPESLTVYDLPPAIRRRLRTTNMLERMNKEIKRRTRVATLFPNDESLLRLVTAVVCEISDEWETGKIYINWKCD